MGGLPDAARRLVEEAQSVAQRRPLSLPLAGAWPRLARLFRDRQALARARELVRRHGYHRRGEELSGAEAAARHWPAAGEHAPPAPGGSRREGG